MTNTFHAKAGADHLIGVDGLRVLISEDADGWFAQGVEIDYFACGSSFEDVQRRFEAGLAATIDVHLNKHGSIENILKWAPPEVVSRLVGSDKYSFSMLSKHEVTLPQFPYHLISYLKEERSRAA